MKELQTIIDTYHLHKDSGQRIALATVVHVEDSSYRRSGARMLIFEDGTWVGGISGGCLEGDTLHKAQAAMYDDKPVVVRYDTRDGDNHQIGVGLGCNGLIDVLIVPIQRVDLSLIESCLTSRNPIILITVVSSDNSSLEVGKLLSVDSNHSLLKQEAVTEAIVNAQLVAKSKAISVVYEGSNTRLFVEYVPPQINLIICGHNYDTLPLAQTAKSLGWKVTFYDNPTKVGKAQYHIADQVINSKTDEPSIDEHTVTTLMAHDYKTDLQNLQIFLTKKTKYIGILGPKKRSIKMAKELGISLVDLPQIYAPVGLDTGATSPEEIAISIVAEIRTHLSGRMAGHLRSRSQRINS